MTFQRTQFPFPEKQAFYLACPRCGLVVLQGSNENGSPHCRDCKEEDDAVVKMDLMVLPINPRSIRLP